MRSEGALTVRELVYESGLDLRLVAGKTGLDKAVTGIHLSDLRDPTPWMVSGSVLITTGPTFAHDAEAGVRLLERLGRIECSAVGIGLGHHMDAIPTQMIDRANALRLPIFQAPYGVPLRTIVAYVYDALAAGDLHRLRRVLAVQSHLLDLVTEEKDLGELVETVASLLEMPVAVFDSRGRLLAGAGPLKGPYQPERLWRSYSTLRGSIGPLGLVESGHSRFYFREVEMFGNVERVLAASSSLSDTSEFVEMSLSFLQRLLSLDLLRQRDQVETARRMRTRLLRDLLSGEEPAEDLEPRMAAQGLEARTPWRITMCEAAAAQPTRRGAPGLRHRSAAEMEELLNAAAEQFLGERRIRFLCMPLESSLVILSEFDEGGEQAARELLAALHAGLQTALSPSVVRVGCSSAKIGCTAAARALHEAQDAVALAGTAPAGESVVLFEDISGRFRLLGGQSDESLRDMYRRTIAPLADNDQRQHTHLVETLAALLEHCFAAQPTADALHIHRNTLHKRLQRIEQLLGVDLDELDDVFELYLGLRAGELLGQSGERRPDD